MIFKSADVIRDFDTISIDFNSPLMPALFPVFEAGRYPEILRKIIILDVKDLPSLTLIGIAVIVLALSAAYFAIKRLSLQARPEKDL